MYITHTHARARARARTHPVSLTASVQVDSVLLHGPPGPHGAACKSEASCAAAAGQWSALEKLYAAKKTRSIGVRSCIRQNPLFLCIPRCRSLCPSLALALALALSLSLSLSLTLSLCACVSPTVAPGCSHTLFVWLCCALWRR